MCEKEVTMSPNLSLSTSVAFDLLHAEIETRLTELQAAIAETAKRGVYEKVGQLAKAAQDLADLKKELTGVEKRYHRLVEADEPDEPAAEGTRIHRGLKTPQAAYGLPILQALVELGGRSDLKPVLDRVYEIMKGQLNEHDLAPLASDGLTPRWRNTAQWERNSLREDGLIRDDTPRSIWEISEKGREWLAEQRKTALR
jgi:restriction system protein